MLTKNQKILIGTISAFVTIMIIVIIIVCSIPNNQNQNCNVRLPQIIRQRLTSDGKLIQVYSGSAILEIRNDVTIIEGDATMILRVKGPSKNIQKQGKQLTIIGWSEIEMSTTWENQDCEHEATMKLNCQQSSCDLHCDGTSICQSLTVEEHIWNFKCTGTSACPDLNAHCTNGKSCTAVCGGTSACKNVKFNGKWEKVDCQGTSTCRDAKFEACGNVNCIGTSSCTDIEIKSSGNVNCRETSACKDLSAHCNDGKHCSANCIGTSTCRNGKFYGNWDTNCRGTSACRGKEIIN